MEYSRHISRQLHEEHLATLKLWGRLEQAIVAKKEPEARALMKEAAAALAGEVTRHFGFEENELFTRLSDAGEGDIAMLLADEHAAIRDAAFEFQQLLASPSADFGELRAVSLELCERLVSHVQKEEMALLPALEDLIDDDADRELFSAYLASA
jgi:hemerythrin-like domain-containing protein